MPIKKTKKRRPSRNVRPVATNCPFCKSDTDPDYKKETELARYISDRAKILPKSRTGLCTKHQRKLAKEIKRARSLGLLPYVASL
ncbi:30S ribosomal protein S18 [Candidatus Woesebacteria bacterium]|nr:30S ribosomal protein S18 [Candidatus Woesebacteria bacterium]